MKKKTMPFVAVGSDELDDAPNVGETVKCWMCGADHPVEYGHEKHGDTLIPSNMLAFFKCGGTPYLCGIGGKEWRPKQ